ncbi:hypothetical protein KY285_029888 [Solanum tuberosum]|nr:hypothetical protein KY285_029888 [Solanum tuberosum]
MTTQPLSISEPAVTSTVSSLPISTPNISSTVSTMSTTPLSSSFSLPSVPSPLVSILTSLSGQALFTSLGSTSGLPFVSPCSTNFDPIFSPTFSSSTSLAAPNIMNLVTIKLQSVEDYLTWRTQFTSLLISYDLLGFVDGSFKPPSPFICDSSRNQQPNPNYRSWMRVDQSVRSWIFATLSREVLVDVHLLPISHDIWLSLNHRYMDASQAKLLDLKRQLTTLRKADSISIDQYLRDAKQIADSLAAINSPFSNQDFIDHHFKGPNPPSLSQAFATQNTHSNSSSTTHSYQGVRGRGRTYSPRDRGHGSSGRFQQYQGSTTNNFPRNDSTGQITPGSHPSTLICQISGSIGHQALQCSNRFNHAFVANDLPKSFATMSVGETNDATWYLDSAASAHMTSSEGYVLTIIVT